MKEEKSLYIVLYPWKFTNFIWNYLELDKMCEKCDVLVLALSSLYDKGFEKKLDNVELINDNIIKVNSYRELINKYIEIKRFSKYKNICILNNIGSGSLFSLLNELLISFFFKKSNVKILIKKNSGIPLFYNNKKYIYNQNILFKIKKYTSIGEVIKKITIFFFEKLEKILRLPYVTHVLVAGEKFEELARELYNSTKVKFIKGHCQDYSNAYLKFKIDDKFPKDSYSTLLDAAEPMFTSDYQYSKRKLFLTSDIWYPSLCNFLKHIEEQFKLSINIAGHYKSNHSFNSNCFDNREVYYNQTFELVRNSNFVITRYSSAISYAVLFKKPILFIFSNQLINDKTAMNHIIGFSQMLGTIPINIDEIPNELFSYLLINNEFYQNYEKMFLTSSKSKIPNCDLIYNELMCNLKSTN